MFFFQRFGSRFFGTLPGFENPGQLRVDRVWRVKNPRTPSVKWRMDAPTQGYVIYIYIYITPQEINISHPGEKENHRLRYAKHQGDMLISWYIVPWKKIPSSLFEDEEKPIPWRIIPG